MSQDPYRKLKNVMEQAENAKVLQMESETRLEKARRVEADAWHLLKECLDKVRESEQKIEEMQKLIVELKTLDNKSTEEFKRKQDLVEKEREMLRSYLSELNTKIKQVIHDKEASDSCVKELEEKNVDLLQNLNHYKVQHDSMRREIEVEKTRILAELEEKRRKHTEDMVKEKERLRVELELQKIKQKEEIERLKNEKKTFEQEMAAQKRALEQQMAQLGELKKRELEDELEERTKKAEIELEKRRQTVVGELEKVKAEAIRKEKELGELLSRAAEAIKERDASIDQLENKVKHMEKDYQKNKEIAEKALQEKEAMSADYELALRSREALLSEMAQLKSGG